jgi:hypothetical protein
MYLFFICVDYLVKPVHDQPRVDGAVVDGQKSLSPQWLGVAAGEQHLYVAVGLAVSANETLHGKACGGEHSGKDGLVRGASGEDVTLCIDIF